MSVRPDMRSSRVFAFKMEHRWYWYTTLQRLRSCTGLDAIPGLAQRARALHRPPRPTRKPRKLARGKRTRTGQPHYTLRCFSSEKVIWRAWCIHLYPHSCIHVPLERARCGHMVHGEPFQHTHTIWIQLLYKRFSNPGRTYESHYTSSVAVVTFNWMYIGPQSYKLCVFNWSLFNGHVYTNRTAIIEFITFLSLNKKKEHKLIKVFLELK